MAEAGRVRGEDALTLDVHGPFNGLDEALSLKARLELLLIPPSI